jgi:uncharacterized protein (TIGR02271 family)
MNERREHTVIAAFRSNSEAEAAANALESEGFSREEIDIETGSSAGTSARRTTARHEGGIKGWFKSIFGEDENTDQREYERAYQQGNALLRVDVSENEISQVEELLNQYSPVEVHAEDEDARTTAAAGTTRTDAAVGRRNTSTAGAIPVVREEIQVGKRQILRGGVRVYSRVVNEPIEENISLREERVRVDRKPVNRQATEADLKGGRDEVIEVREYAEEPVVAKQSRVVEEVRVGKDVSERTETIRDNVRRTEVNVERTAGENGAYGDDADFRSDFERRYASNGGSYDTYRPAYEYGAAMASNPQYRDRDYNEIEPELRSEYGRRYPQSTWDKVKDSVRYGWDKMTGKTKAAVR